VSRFIFKNSILTSLAFTRKLSTLLNQVWGSEHHLHYLHY